MAIETTIPYAFSWHTMFFGAEPLQILFLIEIVMRTTIMYFYTLLNIRLISSRSITQLNSFELIIVIALGTAMGDPMFYPSIPLVSGMITVTVMVLLTQLIEILTERFSFVEKIIEREPVLIIKNGTIIKEQLHRTNLPEKELLERLRLQGIQNVGQIEYAFIESAGQVSIIRASQPKDGISTLNHIK